MVSRKRSAGSKKGSVKKQDGVSTKGGLDGGSQPVLVAGQVLTGPTAVSTADYVANQVPDPKLVQNTIKFWANRGHGVVTPEGFHHYKSATPVSVNGKTFRCAAPSAYLLVEDLIFWAAAMRRPLTEVDIQELVYHERKGGQIRVELCRLTIQKMLMGRLKEANRTLKSGQTPFGMKDMKLTQEEALRAAFVPCVGISVVSDIQRRFDLLQAIQKTGKTSLYESIGELVRTRSRTCGSTFLVGNWFKKPDPKNPRAVEYIPVSGGIFYHYENTGKTAFDKTSPLFAMMTSPNNPTKGFRPVAHGLNLIGLFAAYLEDVRRMTKQSTVSATNEAADQLFLGDGGDVEWGDLRDQLNFNG